MHSCAKSDSFYGKNTLRTVCSVERLPAFTMGWLKTGVSRNNDRVSYKKYRSSSGNQMHVFRNRCALPYFLHRVNWSWICALNSLSKFLNLLWSLSLWLSLLLFEDKTHCYLNRDCDPGVTVYFWHTEVLLQYAPHSFSSLNWQYRRRNPDSGFAVQVYSWKHNY